MDGTRQNARCLCGSVRFSAALADRAMGACHCSFCRRWAAGPFLVVDGARDVSFEAQETLGVYQSSDWGERGFCRSCGTSLFWRMRDGSHYAVSAYAFDDLGTLDFTSEIFIDKKPDDYAFANATRKMTGEEVMAEFAAAGSDGNG